MRLARTSEIKAGVLAQAILFRDGHDFGPGGASRRRRDVGRLVQVALGHRNITNTMIYADYVYSQQELKKLIL